MEIMEYLSLRTVYSQYGIRQEKRRLGQEGREEMITSISNPRMKEIVQLRKKSRMRTKTGTFLVEGVRMIREVPRERLVHLYVTEEFYKKHREEPIFSAEKIFVSPEVFTYISDTKTPQGILAIVRQSIFTEAELLESCRDKKAADGSRPAHILVLDNIQDPGNLGTIFRTAEAVGVTGILLSRDCADIYNPKTIRSTMGAIFRMPFVYVEKLPEAVEKLKGQGIHTFAAHLDGERLYDEEDYCQGTAFLIGNEGNGLRPEAAACADTWVRIPMEGHAESLNAAVAASVLMFEVSRQRRKI